MKILFAGKHDSQKSGERSEVTDYRIYTIFDVLTDIGGFLKIMTMLSGLVLGLYYRNLLHKKLVALFPGYEKVLCYEGII